jgi:hypothetical protein
MKLQHGITMRPIYSYSNVSRIVSGSSRNSDHGVRGRVGGQINLSGTNRSFVLFALSDGRSFCDSTRCSSNRLGSLTMRFDKLRFHCKEMSNQSERGHLLSVVCPSDGGIRSRQGEGALPQSITGDFALARSAGMTRSAAWKAGAAFGLYRLAALNDSYQHNRDGNEQ